MKLNPSYTAMIVAQTRQVSDAHFQDVVLMCCMAPR